MGKAESEMEQGARSSARRLAGAVLCERSRGRRLLGLEINKQLAENVLGGRSI